SSVDSRDRSSPCSGHSVWRNGWEGIAKLLIAYRNVREQSPTQRRVSCERVTLVEALLKVLQGRREQLPAILRDRETAIELDTWKYHESLRRPARLSDRIHPCCIEERTIRRGLHQLCGRHDDVRSARRIRNHRIVRDEVVLRRRNRDGDLRQLSRCSAADRSSDRPNSSATQQRRDSDSRVLCRSVDGPGFVGPPLERKCRSAVRLIKRTGSGRPSTCSERQDGRAGKL